MLSESHNGSQNVGQAERAVSIAAGGALAAIGLRKRGVAGIAMALVGAELARRGLTGHCMLYEKLGVSTHGPADIRDREDVTGRAATVNARKAIKVERTIRIERRADELYDLWRDFSNLPHFMQYLESVQCTDSRYSHWIARLPGGKHVEWDAEIVNDIPGRLIAWKTVGEPDIAHAGSVHFTPLSNADAADVRIVFDYEPPFASTIGSITAQLGITPDALVDRDLQRLKEYVEAGASTGAARRGD
jgi:uncharacterized membrane protein